MNTPSIQIRAARSADLPVINQVIEAAVLSWDLPERVKRLSLPSYRYDELDLADHITVVAETEAAGIVGVAAWARADAKDCPDGRSGMLLHGLYVEPAAQGTGIGSALLGEAEAGARLARADGLLVKAQPDAMAFFRRHGLLPLDGDEPGRRYANRLWKAL